MYDIDYHRYIQQENYYCLCCHMMHQQHMHRDVFIVHLYLFCKTVVFELIVYYFQMFRFVGSQHQYYKFCQ